MMTSKAHAAIESARRQGMSEKRIKELMGRDYIPPGGSREEPRKLTIEDIFHSVAEVYDLDADQVWNPDIGLAKSAEARKVARYLAVKMLGADPAQLMTKRHILDKVIREMTGIMVPEVTGRRTIRGPREHEEIRDRTRAARRLAFSFVNINLPNDV